MTPEGKVKQKIKQWYKDNLPNHWRVSPRGGPFGKTGCSDDVICWLGFFVAVEVKSETGQLTDLQLKNLRDVQLAGGIAAVVKGYDVDRLELVKQLVLNKHEALQAGLKCLSQ